MSDKDKSPEDLTNELLENVMSPKRASGDSGSAEQFSASEQIEAIRFKLAQQAAKRGLGFRRVQLRPGGNSDVNVNGSNI